MSRSKRRDEESFERMEDRLAQCEEALAEGIKFKVSGNDFSPAIRVFEDAYRLATDEPRLPRPWPQIAAYRLGHVLMRTARTYGELQRVEELLQEAGRRPVDVLGPVPSVYRLAALHRMADVAPDSVEAARCRAARKRLFVSLVEGATAPEPPFDFNRSSRAAAVQGTLHNYLELASYFTGEPYGDLQGLRSPTGDLLLEDEWRIVGSHGLRRTRHVRLPYSLARTELESRAEEGQPELLFELDDISMGGTGVVWRPGCETVRVGLRPMLLLLKYCRSPQANKEELERAVIPAGEEGGTNLRSVVADLRAALGRYKEIEGKPVIGEGSRSRPPRLNADVRVLGMVHEKRFHKGPPRIGRYERQSNQ